MRTRGHTPACERLARECSRLGEHAGCWLVLGATGSLRAAAPGRRRAWRCATAAVAGSYAANYLVKLAVRRPRPDLVALAPLTPVVSRFSFPSAHATTSFTAARAYRTLAPGWALYSVATLMALTRPYLGVHYPSDVLAGALLGMAIGSLARCGGQPCR
jgi:membrane-associated phospholipid phosphatase